MIPSITAMSSTASPPRVRMEIVDILRGLAALSVTWFHISNTFPDGGLIQKSGAYGWLGIEVFFVISGFIIPTSISHGYSNFGYRDAPRYMLRRMVRLEPPYIASLVTVLILWQISFYMPSFNGAPPQLDLRQILAHLFYAIPLTNYGWLQPVYWSLAYEFVFYILCGLFFRPVIGQIKKRVIYFFAVLITLGLVFGPLSPRALLFVIGIAVYRRKILHEHPTMVLVVIGACLAVMVAEGMALQAAVGAISALIIYLLSEHNFRRTILVSGALWLGTISYSLYLIHVPIGGRVVNLGSRFVAGTVQPILLAVLALLISILAAYIFYRLFERPAVRAAKHIGAEPKTVSGLP